MYVTCLYDIYNRPEKIDEYIKLFQPFVDSGLPIHLYTSSDLIHHFKNYPKNIKVLEVPLSYFELYTFGINSTCNLPAKRTENKDTREYLSLMNTKIEFLLRSSEICEDENLIWIDFAILKLFKNKENAIEKLKQYSNLHFKDVTIPGCWNYGTRIYLDYINWRFCGTMLIMPRNHLHKFYNAIKDCYTHFIISDNILTWEVNVWYYVEYSQAKDYIKWYYALHNDTMVDNLLTIFDSECAQKI